MSTLEREILERFHRLPFEEKQRVVALMEQEILPATRDSTQQSFDFAVWSRSIAELRQSIRTAPEALTGNEVVALLREIRDGEDE